MKRSEPSREANIWVARGVPVFLVGIVAYTSWVVTRVLCIDYLLQPSSLYPTSSQTNAAIAILIIYYLVLLVATVCYARLLYVVTKIPGLVPRGPQWYVEQRRKASSQRPRSRRRRHSSSEKSKTIESDSSVDKNSAEAVTSTIAHDSDLQVEDFWKRDVFTCNYDGRPAFCSSCYNWKPDRAHHCSELDRCVLKMDHFCPWVGGVVGETSFKFFTQFTFWAALYWTHTLVSIAYYFAQRRNVEGIINVHWTVVLGISSLFLLFSAGMCMSSLQFVFINTTTIENLSRKRKVWYLAVHVPDDIIRQMEERGRSNLRLIVYPRPQTEQFQVLEQNGVDMSQQLVDSEIQPELTPRADMQTRTFAILETAAGTNPFDLGLKLNFYDIMGSTIYEWLFPIHPSPCTRHDSLDAFYGMNSAVQHLKREAKIPEEGSHSGNRRRRSRRTRSRSHSRRRSRSLKAEGGS